MDDQIKWAINNCYMEAYMNEGKVSPETIEATREQEGKLSLTERYNLYAGLGFVDTARLEAIHDGEIPEEIKMMTAGFMNAADIIVETVQKAKYWEDKEFELEKIMLFPQDLESLEPSLRQAIQNFFLETLVNEGEVSRNVSDDLLEQELKLSLIERYDLYVRLGLVNEDEIKKQYGENIPESVQMMVAGLMNAGDTIANACRQAKFWKDKQSEMHQGIAKLMQGVNLRRGPRP